MPTSRIAQGKALLKEPNNNAHETKQNGPGLKSNDISIVIPSKVLPQTEKKPAPRSRALNLTPQQDAMLAYRLEQRVLRPPPGTRGWNFKVANVVLCYCPSRFDTFQFRTNFVMTVTQFKERIASRYRVSASNIIVGIRD